MFTFTQPTYNRLRLAHAERRRPIAFWLGAGFSAPAGFPTWAKLRADLVIEATESLVGVEKNIAEIKEQELELAAKSTNYWEAFETIKKILGRPNFVASIRRTLDGAAESDVPDLYKSVWELSGVNAVLTLNIDRFVERAHRLVRPRENPITFNGRQAPAFSHLLGARKPFIANLHGIVEDQTSWIFTRSDVNRLLEDSAYKNFLELVFGSMTVVFAGISADDGAAGGTLAQMTDRGVDLGEHFWITDRPGEHQWAAKAGLQVVRYTPEATGPERERHVAPLREMFADLKAFTSRDAPAATIVPRVDSVASLPASRELRLLDEDDLRRKLSGYAKTLLESNGLDTKASNYVQFTKEYSSNIHQAWHVTDDPPDNVFYGYTVTRRVHSSPFSTVWELGGKSGTKLALKVLQIENLRAGPQIESFRRGVESLTYLTNANVPGTASLVAAYEIPTAVVMEYVEGASLSEIVPAEIFEVWPNLLLVMANVCRHLIYSHNLPQGVLHRDVRPSNIMLPYAYWSEEDAAAAGHARVEVALLNYDMSWHSRAAGEEMTGDIQEVGYYAPEQVHRDQDAARSTLVDSYGVGMSLFFAFTGTAPPTGGGADKDWDSLLELKFRADPRLNWRSAPVRLRRLIRQATLPLARDRLSVTQIEGELRLLAHAVNDEFDELPLDFWAEELMSRSEDGDYKVADNGFEYVRTPREGRLIIVRGDIKRNSIVVSFKNQAVGSTDRGSDRLWNEKLQRAKQILSSSGWEGTENGRYSGKEILLGASVHILELKKYFDRLVDGLKKGLQNVRLD